MRTARRASRSSISACSKVVSEANTGANATRSLGTPLYMAPEQVLGQSVSPATDLYSLGLIAYTLIVGVSYWQSDAEKFENAIAFVLHTTKGATESAVARAARVGRPLPPAFDAWFQRATHLEPARRFRRASELVSELAALLGSADTSQAVAALPVAQSGTIIQTNYPCGIRTNRDWHRARNRVRSAGHHSWRAAQIE